MSKHKSIFAFIMLFAFSVFSTALYAAEESVPLKGTLWEKVKGEAIIKDTANVEGDKQLTVNVSGLEPNSVYTVWFGKIDRPTEVKGAGVRDYSFKTDGAGNGTYVTTLSEYVIQGWDNIQVAFHPDGNPKNLNNAQIALSGDLRHRRR
ncbi:MAG: hypothetical protein HY893_07835 [Deltaproteobacteria bacterium]|nr:hypothetical protein [Deltaproteobacteria bacterium]